MKCSLLIMYNNIIKPMLNNPDASDKRMENEEIEFKEPPTQRAMKKRSTSQSVSCYVKFITFSKFLILLTFFVNWISDHDFWIIQTIENCHFLFIRERARQNLFIYDFCLKITTRLQSIINRWEFWWGRSKISFICILIINN